MEEDGRWSKQRERKRYNGSGGRGGEERRERALIREIGLKDFFFFKKIIIILIYFFNVKSTRLVLAKLD